MDDIKRSLQILTEAPVSSAAPLAAKAGGKIASRLVPGLGAAAGAYDAYQRGKAGDTTGAAIAGLTGAASTIPVVGTAAALAGTGIQAIRDKWRTGSWLPDEQQIAAAAQQDGATQQATTQPATAVGQVAQAAKNVAQPATAKADANKVNKFKELLSKVQPSPTVQVAGNINKVKGTIMSESDKIAALRTRLAQIEETSQVNEAPLSTLANLGSKAVGAIKNAGQNFQRGLAGAAPRTATGQFTKAGGATQLGRAIGANPGKAAAIGTGAGLAAGVAGTSALGGADAGQQGASAEPGTSAQSAAPAGLSPKADPSVVKIQQELKAKGADLGGTGPNKDGVDGIMGPKTRAAMQKFGMNGTAPAAGSSAQPATSPAPAPSADSAELDALAKELSAFKDDPEIAKLLQQYNTVKSAAAPAKQESSDPLISIKQLAGL